MTMKRTIFVLLTACAVVAAGFASTVWIEMHRAPSSNRGALVRLEVPPGQPFSAIARRLESLGLVQRARPLRLYAAAAGYDRRIHQGTYEFTIGERPVDILRRLSDGDILVVEVTIPEGFTKWEISAAFAPAGVDSAELDGAMHDPEVRERRNIPTSSLEGYLFPDTYRVPYRSSAAQVVAMMLARMDEVFDTVLLARTAELDMTPQEVLTLASIVEAEARIEDERAIVSAVYHNRLSRNMRLEADPTVAYAMDGYRGRLYYKDLEIDSPYNTYRHVGLPPGPICSPGEASIQAALHPDPNTDALYFVARGDGSHIFSRTLSAHNDAVRRVRREYRRTKPSSTGAKPSPETGNGAANN